MVAKIYTVVLFELSKKLTNETKNTQWVDKVKCYNKYCCTVGTNIVSKILSNLNLNFLLIYFTLISKNNFLNIEFYEN